MLPFRRYEAKPGDVLYHYCSPSTFISIVKSGCLRFTDIFGMNDYLEVKWGYKKFIETANKNYEALGKDFIEAIDRTFGSISLKLLPLLSCFSCDGDVLSQWRAYTDDASGFAIGFDANMLVNLPVAALRVCYQEEEQNTEMEFFLKKTLEFWKKNEKKIEGEFWEYVAGSLIDTCAYKNPAFREEQEVRLVHVVQVEWDLDKKTVSLMKSTGRKFGVDIMPEDVNHFLSKDLIRFYIDIEFKDWPNGNPIKEIILGPKNPNLPTAIALVLARYGLEATDIRRSSASYR